MVETPEVKVPEPPATEAQVVELPPLTEGRPPPASSARPSTSASVAPLEPSSPPPTQPRPPKVARFQSPPLQPAPPSGVFLGKVTYLCACALLCILCYLFTSFFSDVLMRCLGENRRSRPSVLSGQPLNPYELFILRARFTDTEAAVLAGFGGSCCFLMPFLLCV